jgi:long-chain acyl-CoA synthetase
MVRYFTKDTGGDVALSRLRAAVQIFCAHRLAISGGAALPVELLHAFERAFDVPIIEGYGLSVTSPMIGLNRLGLARKPGSIGRPLFGTELRNVDEMDMDVPVGQPGAIVVRSHSVVKGYCKRSRGDGGGHAWRLVSHRRHRHQDGDGYCYVADRKKDMIPRAGVAMMLRARSRVARQCGSNYRSGQRRAARGRTAWQTKACTR